MAGGFECQRIKKDNRRELGRLVVPVEAGVEGVAHVGVPALGGA
jgi:hypothetical protein